METIDILWAIMSISIFMFTLFRELTGTKLMNNLFAKIVIYFAMILFMITWIAMMFIIIFILHH